jgi:hypothetical protein
MSEVKVNKISPRSGTEVTLGDSGDTFTIPSGATINNQGTATNFGATGSASWNTTVKTSGFTAVAGEGYFVDTTSGPITVNLPAGTAGAVVAFKDYAGTFDTNAVTLDLNGSDKIGGSTTNPILGDEGIAVTLVFIDSTQGWLVTDSGLQSEVPGPEYISATGGTVTTVCTNFKVHTFTGPGTFTVCSAGNAAGSNTVDYLVVAGGGGGGHWYGAGAGAGGYRFSDGTASGSYAAGPSPLGASAAPVTASSFPITVGGGGTGGTYSPAARGTSGGVSTFSTITSAGGGAGGGNAPGAGATYYPGGAGGSGGAAKANASFTGVAGAGNTPPSSPPQGNTAGNSNAPGSPENNAGGAGAGGASNPAPTDTPNNGGYGGVGLASSITGSPVGRGGGGSGNGDTSPYGNANPTGYPFGGGKSNSPTTPGASATVNTGGGGGAGPVCAPNSTNAGTGGSGIVIIRYRFQ